jgi:hypothetical protein
MTAELAETTAPDSWGPRSRGLRQAGRCRGRSARRTLARSWRDDQVVGAGIPQRTVIVEFESFEKALAAYKATRTKTPRRYSPTAPCVIRELSRASTDISSHGAIDHDAKEEPLCPSEHW